MKVLEQHYIQLEGYFEISVTAGKELCGLYRKSCVPGRKK